MPIVQLIDVNKKYPLGKTEVHAVKGVTFSIEEGDFISIAGPSGSGKSTILNLIGCIDTPTEGTVSIDGTPTDELADREKALHVGQIAGANVIVTGTLFHLDRTFQAITQVIETETTYVKGALSEGPSRSFPYEGERVGKQLVQGFALCMSVFKFLRKGRKRCRLEGTGPLFFRVDVHEQRKHLLEVLLVLRTKQEVEKLIIHSAIAPKKSTTTVCRLVAAEVNISLLSFR